jgi:phosphatidylglycerol:prolipoprotein diacylglycerol transferase
MTNLLFIHWNPNPEIFSHHFESIDFTFRMVWYGPLFATGFVLGYYLLRSIFRKEGVEESALDKVLIYTVIGTVVGARFGHILFYDPGHYFSNPSEILKIWKGGLASHGAAIGIILALWYYSKKVSKRSMFWIMDRIVIAIALGSFFIRLGNLMNSEIIGSPTTVAWAFKFYRHDFIPRHPAQLYEAISYLILFAVLWYMYWKKDFGRFKGRMLGYFFVIQFGMRIAIEFTKQNQALEDGAVLNMGQILSIPLLLVGVYLLYRSYTTKEELPGLTQKEES